jgi:Zn-finger nucleic acid-binding protein
MKCTQCRGYELEPAELEPGLIAAACPKCEGALLSLLNYRFWMDQHPDLERAEEDREQKILIENTEEQAHCCPKCSRLMTKYTVANETKNKIDLCAGCDEAWLDKGEWNLLKQLDLQDKLPRIFTDAWQRNIRIEHRMQMQKQRYEKMWGEVDFAKVDEFKAWLDQHPERELMCHYLTTKFDA